MLSLLNTQRQNNGCNVPLTSNQKLWNAAQRHAVDMATHAYFSHDSQDGTTFDQRIDAEGYVWSMVAENIAAGQGTPSAVVTSWMNSSGHRANILNCSLKEIGIGYYFIFPDPNPGNFKNYWVTDFGTQLVLHRIAGPGNAGDQGPQAQDRLAADLRRQAALRQRRRGTRRR